MTFNHPIFFAAAAVAFIGFAIYEILSSQNGRTGHRRRPPSPPKDDPPDPPSPSKKSPKHPPAETTLNKNSSDDLKKPTETPSTRDNQNIHTKEFDKNNVCKIMPDKLSRPSTPPDNNLREPNFDQISSESSSNDLEKSTEISSTEACQDVQDKFNENNFSKNMLDKPNNDTKNVSENLKSGRNIIEEESIACGSISSPKDAKKSSNQTASDVDDCNKEVSYIKNMQSYKNEVYNTLLNDIHATIEDNERKEDMSNELVIDPSGESKEQQPAESNICEAVIDPSGESKEQQPEESNICEACEENHIKTRAYPCNHSYLCVDCAVRIFRIYRKCKVCLQPVEEFVQFSS